MAVDGLVALTTALQDKQFGKVTGTAECSWVDFKQTGYGVDSENARKLSRKGKWELCKDVAAFANDNGGCLVLGFKEEQSPELGVAVAGEVTPIAKQSLDVTHYKDVLQQHVYPLVRDVEFHWYPTTNPDKAVLLINVRASSEKPHIVRTMTDVAGNKIEGFGIPRRNDDRVNWYTAESIHTMISETGRTRLAPGLSGAATQPEEHQKVYARAKATRESLIKSREWDDKPVLILQSIPLKGPERLNDFYDGIRAKIERPTPIRPMGFGLGALGRTVDDVEGSFMVEGSRDAVIRLEPDGLFTVALETTEQFIGWAVNKENDAGDPTKINATVLIELSFEFSRFIWEVLAPNGLVEWEYLIDFRNLKKNKIALGPGRPNTLGYDGEQKIATADSWIKKITKGDDASSDAFKVLTEAYALFALSDKVIPFTHSAQVVPQQIIDLNKNPW